ncbi:hypothetical protein L6R49_26805 [Myxococcota bacterium]|nr:hypothetical protein [Myxococcota bacterium]
MLTLMKRIWRGWKRLAHHIVSAQNFVLMSVVYWFALAPVAVALKLVGKKVIAPPPEKDAQGSFWRPRAAPGYDLQRANRMF